VQHLDPFQQRRSQRSEAGTDLDDALSGSRIDRRRDALRDAAIDQKILAESPARPVRVYWIQEPSAARSGAAAQRSSTRYST
jgi:hypothetical protein